MRVEGLNSRGGGVVPSSAEESKSTLRWILGTFLGTGPRTASIAERRTNSSLRSVDCGKHGVFQQKSSAGDFHHLN